MDMCCAVQGTKISNRYVPYSLFCEDCLDEIYLSCLSIITVLAGKSVGCCSKNGVEKKEKQKEMASPGLEPETFSVLD